MNLNLKKIVKVAGIAFAGYVYGWYRAGYYVSKDEKTKEAAKMFADEVDVFKETLKRNKKEPKTTEEVAEDITEMVSDAAEEVAEAVEEAASEVVPDITVTTNDSEEESNQPED